MKRRLYLFFLLFLLIFNVKTLRCQSIANGFPYQTIVRDNSGLGIVNQMVSIKSGIYSGTPGGSLVWEETFNLSTDSRGLIKFVIGTGISTGMGAVSSFSSVNLGANSHYIKISLDTAGGVNYTDVGAAQLFSVPYAFYAMNSDEITHYYLDQLADVATPAPLIGKLLKWNGTFWISDSDLDSDTALFVYNSFHSDHADTSFYSYSSSWLDSVLFAYNSDTVQFTNISQQTSAAVNTVYSDTALFAFASAPIAWSISGNLSGVSANQLGTNDGNDFILKTNSSEVMRISTSGSLTVGTPTGGATFTVNGNDGLLATGTLGTGLVALSGAGTKLLWYPVKAAFRVGGVSGTSWDSINLGNYSFTAGYNCIAGTSSFAAGNGAVASGDYTIAIGRKVQATATGIYPSGVSVAIGDSSTASTPRSLVIGRGNVASTNNATYAIGYNNKATGAVGTAFGVNTMASGNYSIVFGYYASSNLKTGSFVYADASSNLVTNATANNQFMVRATGGVMFYSDPFNTMGVSLPAGGGSWASVSDKNKKENFKSVSAEAVLTKIEKMAITSWNYRSESEAIRHIGPMSQDFYKAFKLGDNKKTISVIDMDGVTLLGIKALALRMQNLSSVLIQTKELEVKTAVLDDFYQLNTRMDELEKKYTNQKETQLKNK